MLSQRLRKHYYKSLGTTVQYTAYCPLSPWFEIEYSGNAKFTAQEKEKIGIFSGKGGDNAN